MRFFSLALITLSALAPALSQTTLNPDISVIPRFLLETNDGERLDEGVREFSRPNFSFQELEVVASGYLNPFARADVVLALPGPDLEEGKLGLEELYATVLRGLPLDLNVRFGKYRAEFGKINLQHPHQWSFVTQPISQERFLGEEGLNDLGLSASVLLPTGDVYTKLTVDLLRGRSVGEAAGIEDSTGESQTYANSARVTSFFPLGEFSDLEVGVSTYTGIHDPYNGERFWYLNGDFKYKYKPDSYTSVTVQGEYLLNTRRASMDRELVPFVNESGDPEERRITSSGAYLFVDYQFMKTYSLGARFDWSQAPYSTEERAIGAALFFGYYPVEESLGLRLHYQHTREERHESTRNVNMIGLQAIFSLGPHRVHQF